MASPGDVFDGNDFLLPDLGEGLEECEIVEWIVEPGAAVEEGDPLALVETGKAQTELMAPRDGVIDKLLVEPGTMVSVGKPVVTYADTSVDAPAKADADASRSGAASERSEPETAVATTTEAPAAKREDGGTVVGALSEAANHGDKPQATPAVRKLARDRGVDLSLIRGTGVGGRIVARDVEAAAPQPYMPQPVSKTGGNGSKHKPGALHGNGKSDLAGSPRMAADDSDTIHVPFRGLRRVIADRLRESVDRAVHFTVMDEADVTLLESQRRRLVAATGIKVSLLPFVCAAVARVLSGEMGPDLVRLNSTVDDEQHDILRHKTVHLGLAVDTSDGLMVPVIRDARKLGVMELGRRIAETAAACRSRSIPAGELRGSTFTISNFGSYPGGRFATPILNYPEAAILAVGRAREGVVVKGGLMGVGKLLPLSLTCDHRVIDGGTAVGGLNAILQLLQNPDSLMPES